MANTVYDDMIHREDQVNANARAFYTEKVKQEKKQLTLKQRLKKMMKKMLP